MRSDSHADFNKRLILETILSLILVSNVITYQAQAQEIVKPTDPRGLIVYYSNIYGADTRLTLAIAKAESHFKNVPNYLYDGELGKYSAYGIYQFTRTTWMQECTPDKSERMDIEKNIECAVRLISEGKESHWNESKSKWLKTKNNPIEWFLEIND